MNRMPYSTALHSPDERSAAVAVLATLAGAFALTAPAQLHAGEPAHTSPQPQPLPFKPTNLYSSLSHEELVAEIEARFDPADWPAHVERVTRGLVSAPYLLSALGEGRGEDTDPRFRLDAFDCTTLVETALALANSPEYDELEPLLDQIRYTDGRPGFQSRRHLITSQWIPELTAAGFVRDITTEIGQEDTRFIHLELTRRRWLRRKVARTLPLQADRVPYGTYHLPYLSLESAQRMARHIPPGSIINVVRSQRPRSPDVVTHQGLVVVKPGRRRRMVRHASPLSKRVIDESLAHMLKRYLKHRRWPVVGINVLEIVPMSERGSRLGSTGPNSFR